MTKRFELKTGDYGLYIYDTQEHEDLSFESVLSYMNGEYQETRIRDLEKTISIFESNFAELKEKIVCANEEIKSLEDIKKSLSIYPELEMAIDVLSGKAVFFVDENFNVKNIKNEVWEGKQRGISWSYVYNSRLRRQELVCDISNYSDLSGTQRPIEFSRSLEDAHKILGEKYKAFFRAISPDTKHIPYNSYTIAEKARKEGFISDELLKAEAYLHMLRLKNKKRELSELEEKVKNLSKELGEAP